MSKMAWRPVAHAELAQLLKGAALGGSSAVGASTVYHFNRGGREYVALSMPDGQAVLVEPTGPAVKKRRHIDPAPTDKSA